MEHGPSGVGVVFTLALFLTSTCVVHSVPPPAPVPVPASVRVKFDTTAANGYKDSRSAQRSMLLAGEGSKIVGKHGILPRAPKDPKVKPKRWLQLDMVGAQHDTASLYLRHDNLYVLGFANRTGHVHYLKGNSALFPADSTEVPFGETYGDLTRMQPTAISDVLQKVPLGQHAAQAATHALATYQGHATQDQSAAKSAVLTFCLMVAEAQRFHPIGDKCEQEWLGTRFLSEEEAQYIGNWSLLSFVYCRKDKGEPWTKGTSQMKRMKIHTQKQLREVLDLVLWVDKCDDMHDEN